MNKFSKLLSIAAALVIGFGATVNADAKQINTSKAKMSRPETAKVEPGSIYNHTPYKLTLNIRDANGITKTVDITSGNSISVTGPLKNLGVNNINSKNLNGKNPFCSIEVTQEKNNYFIKSTKSN